jgi:hypothetical protein
VFLEGMRRATTLAHLILGGTQISDPGLAYIAGFNGLGTLTLDRTSVSDNGLACLTGLHTLCYLSLEGTAVSEAGVLSLAESLPSCKIRALGKDWKPRCG